MGSCLCKAEQVVEGDPLTEKSQTGGSFLIASVDCRMCFEKQTGADDPVVHLGCKCLAEELNCAHESCIRKWFPKRYVRTGIIACEVCKAKLGKHATSIVEDDIRSKLFQYLLRRGLAQVDQTFHRIISAILAVNEAIEYGTWLR